MQFSQRRQPMCASTTTRSPTRNSSTVRPTATTSPAYSCPKMNSPYGGIWGMPVWMIFRSVPQTPQARTRTRTSSSPTTGTGLCCSSKRCGATRTVACIVRGMFMQTPFRASGYNVPFRSDRFCAAPDNGQDGRAVLGGHAVNAPVRPVVQVAGRHDARFVGIRAFEQNDELVADVTMRRQRRARLEARQQRAALGGLVLPAPVLTHAGARVDPRQVAEDDDLRAHRTAGIVGQLDVAGEHGEGGRAILRRDVMDASVGPVHDVAGG